MARLGSVCKFFSGTGFPNVYQGQKTGKYPFYKVGDISKNVLSGNRELINCDNYIDDDTVQAIKGTVLPPKTVVFAKIGEALRLNRRAITNCCCLIDNNAMGILPNNVALDELYFYYFMCSVDLQHYCESTTVPSVKKTRIAEIEIPLPPLETQRHIAVVLDKVSNLISLRKQQLAKLDELVKSRFIELFGDPITNEMGWKKVQLSTCLESIDNGKSLVCDASARQGNWPAVLKLSAATYGFYRPEENKAMLDENQFVEDAAVRAGDLLFTRKNTPELVGMCAYVYDTPSRLMMPDLIFRLNTTNRCNKVFLWKLINHDLFRDCIQTIATGSAKSMSNISKERLLSLEIILPPAELQEQFAAFVKQTDKSKLAVQKSLDKLEVLKKALMQQYFG